MSQPRDRYGRFLSDRDLKYPTTRKQQPPTKPKLFTYEPRSLSELGFCKILVVPDTHFPNHDEKAMVSLCKATERFRPHITVLLGDTHDCRIVNPHWRKKLNLKTISKSKIRSYMDREIEQRNVYTHFISGYTSEMMFLLEGNHEGWRELLVAQNPELKNDNDFSVRNFFKLPDYIKWIPQYLRLKIGNCYFEHGHKILNSRGSENIAKSMHSRRPHSNTFTGHWHCVDKYTRVEYAPDNTPSPHTTATLGHLSELDSHRYVNLPNWTQGWGEIVMWIDDKGNYKFSFDQIELMDYKYARGGNFYD